MNKFVSLSASMMLAFTAAYAAAPEAHVSSPTAYQGFYLGLQAGPNITTGKLRAEMTYNGTDFVNAHKNGNLHLEKYAFSGGIFGGYGWVFSQNGYLGLEVFLSYDSTKANAILDNDFGTTSAAPALKQLRLSAYGKDTLRRRFLYGAKADVGYLFTKETMGYIILGIEGGRWKLSSWRVGSVSGQLGAHFGKRKHRIAFKPGLGFRHSLTNNVFLRLEWTTSWNPRIRAHRTQVTEAAPIDGFSAKAVRTKNLVQNTVMLGVGYKF